MLNKWLYGQYKAMESDLILLKILELPQKLPCFVELSN